MSTAPPTNQTLGQQLIPEQSIEVAHSNTEMQNIASAEDSPGEGERSEFALSIKTTKWAVFVVPTLLNWLLVVFASVMGTTATDSHGETYSVDLFRTWNFEIVFCLFRPLQAMGCPRASIYASCSIPK